jgi:hypothetical protein
VFGSNNGNDNLSIDIATDFRIQFFPFLGEEGRDLLQQGLGFFAEKSICGNHEQGKMMMLSEACLKVILLLLLLLLYLFQVVSLQDFDWVFGAIVFGVYICDADVYNATSPASPEAMDQCVSLVFALVLVKVEGDLVIWRCKVILWVCGENGVDSGFFANCVVHLVSWWRS